LNLPSSATRQNFGGLRSRRPASSTLRLEASLGFSLGPPHPNFHFVFFSSLAQRIARSQAILSSNSARSFPIFSPLETPPVTEPAPHLLVNEECTSFSPATLQLLFLSPLSESTRPPSSLPSSIWPFFLADCRSNLFPLGVAWSGFSFPPPKIRRCGARLCSRLWTRSVTLRLDFISRPEPAGASGLTFLLTHGFSFWPFAFNSLLCAAVLFAFPRYSSNNPRVMLS